MKYTKEEVALFNKIFELKYEVDAIATLALTEAGTTEEVSVNNDNYHLPFVDINVPKSNEVLRIAPTTIGDPHQTCIKAFDAYLATNDWNAAYEILEPYFD